jgi:uncharacterized protein (DUF1778 family)
MRRYAGIRALKAASAQLDGGRLKRELANHLQRVYIDLMARPTDKTPSVKGHRLSIRIQDRDRDLFDRAAEANRETLTQFLVAGGRERAERLLADRTRFQLSPDARDELVAIMDREASPNPKLGKLFSRCSDA